MNNGGENNNNGNNRNNLAGARVVGSGTAGLNIIEKPWRNNNFKNIRSGVAAVHGGAGAGTLTVGSAIQALLGKMTAAMTTTGRGGAAEDGPFVRGVSKCKTVRREDWSPNSGIGLGARALYTRWLTDPSCTTPDDRPLGIMDSNGRALAGDWIINGFKVDKPYFIRRFGQNNVKIFYSQFGQARRGAQTKLRGPGPNGSYTTNTGEVWQSVGAASNGSPMFKYPGAPRQPPVKAARSSTRNANWTIPKAVSLEKGTNEAEGDLTRWSVILPTPTTRGIVRCTVGEVKAGFKAAGTYAKEINQLRFIICSIYVMVLDMKRDPAPHPWKDFDFIFEGVIFAASPLHVWDVIVKEHDVAREVAHIELPAGSFTKYVAVKIRRVNYNKFCEVFSIDKERYWKVIQYTHQKYINYLQAIITRLMSDPALNAPLTPNTMLPVRVKLSVPENLPIDFGGIFQEKLGKPRVGEKGLATILKTKLNGIKVAANNFKRNIQARPTQITNADKERLKELHYAMLSHHASLLLQNFNKMNNQNIRRLAAQPNVAANLRRLPNIPGVNLFNYKNISGSSAAGNINNQNLTGFNVLTLGSGGNIGGVKNTTTIKSPAFRKGLVTLKNSFGTSASLGASGGRAGGAALPAYIATNFAKHIKSEVNGQVRNAVAIAAAGPNARAAEKKRVYNIIMSKINKALPRYPAAPISAPGVENAVKRQVANIVNRHLEAAFKKRGVKSMTGGGLGSNQGRNVPKRGRK